MPFSRPTLADLVNQISSDIKSNLTDANAWLRRTVLGVLSRAFAGALHGLYGFISYVAKQVFPDTAEKAFLRRWASIWGVKPKPAQAASGNVTFTGLIGSTIPVDTVLQRSDGVEYVTLAALDLTAETGTVAVEAIAGGATGNLDAGATLALVEPIVGVQTNVTVAAGGLSQGSDAEDDESLLARLLNRIQRPPHGGNKDDYVTWAKDQEAHGIDVTRAWSNPLELGLGTVVVRFMMDDTYGDGIPLPADVATVASYIAEVHPVTADVTVVPPVAVAVVFEISGLTPGNAAVRSAIEAELRDLIRREAEPGSTLLISHIREAISTAAGETDHVLVAPNANLIADTHEIFTFGNITWS
ncbi:MAG: baseplate J/gp47 family protein [Rhodospirillales bacterium]|jgi:uncharacterized phage protein gp47/JayE|nr:baseplate J/gp47 family protein [Rhodospirillales bacterium]